MVELGIDEAGRGPVLGPLVLCGVALPDTAQSKLRDEWGIKDSKKFNNKKKRKELSEKIREHFQHKIIVVPPEKIDHYVREKSLNILEQESAREIINSLSADSVILDGANLFKSLQNGTGTIKAINKADENHLSVAAASIIAKTVRDELFEQLCAPYEKEFGEIRGGGYPNKQTLEFVKWYRKKFKGLPEFYRKSYNWSLLSEIE